MLTDKVAPVTSSTSGIGLGIARTLASAGANILLNGFGEPALIDKLLDERAARQGISVDRARADLLGEAQIRGIALPVDGAWTAQ